MPQCQTIFGQVNLFSEPDPEVDEIVRQVQEQQIATLRKSGNSSTDPSQTTGLVTVHASWATVRKTLSTHQVATIVWPTDNGKVLRIRKGMTPEPAHLELYRLLKVAQEFMHPIKTWS
jgi:hypothetical protein